MEFDYVVSKTFKKSLTAKHGLFIPKFNLIAVATPFQIYLFDAVTINALFTVDIRQTFQQSGCLTSELVPMGSTCSFHRVETMILSPCEEYLYILVTWVVMTPEIRFVKPRQLDSHQGFMKIYIQKRKITSGMSSIKVRIFSEDKNFSCLACNPSSGQIYIIGSTPHSHESGKESHSLHEIDKETLRLTKVLNLTLPEEQLWKHAGIYFTDTNELLIHQKDQLFLYDALSFTILKTIKCELDTKISFIEQYSLSISQIIKISPNSYFFVAKPVQLKVLQSNSSFVYDLSCYFLMIGTDITFLSHLHDYSFICKEIFQKNQLIFIFGDKLQLKIYDLEKKEVVLENSRCAKGLKGQNTAAVSYLPQKSRFVIIDRIPDRICSYIIKYPIPIVNRHRNLDLCFGFH